MIIFIMICERGVRFFPLFRYDLDFYWQPQTNNYDRFLFAFVLYARCLEVMIRDNQIPYRLKIPRIGVCRYSFVFEEARFPITKIAEGREPDVLLASPLKSLYRVYYSKWLGISCNPLHHFYQYPCLLSRIRVSNSLSPFYSVFQHPYFV